ncbi:MAG TPA: DUF2231 domain-containing protein [Caulobacteraceae bacterium]|nr:DUF2231 domain-containing protein [Caulobacteraceae bacterium]
MTEMNPHSTAKIAGHPLHPMLIPFPIAFLVSALVTDLIATTQGRPGFAEASMWLLGAGVAMGLLAAVFGFIDFFGERRIRALREVWLHMVGNLIAVALAAVNFYLRSTEGAQGSVPATGLVLSLLVVLLLLFNGWMGWAMVYKRHVGIADNPNA